MVPESLHAKKRPLRSYIWDTWDKSPEERKFLGKLDACLLTYAALSTYLDQQNVTNAVGFLLSFAYLLKFTSSY
ncbi:hypothetical protein EDD18DRAFT_1348944 [Armillaria luteobubalina]|uniref:Uncharacterized protein n=1 Tax=Armillaria luteobubalina TaxID=153913 RepID=A0AA39QD48_9AGAR|nr:hypothetical protein EDD18DRAFT_1348944 [Armillaria luteobubalina]